MGCAIPLVCLLIIFGAVGILTGNWAALAAPKVPAAPPAVADIPTDYLVLYQQAATACPGLDWTILAAIGKIESDHGRSTLPGVQRGANAAGAQVIYGRSRRWARERSGATRPCLAGISWVCGT